MIRPYKSRSKSSGIAIVAVLISAVIFLGIIVAITGTLSVSTRKSTGDQRVTLEAQYAAESGLSRVVADGQANLLKDVTQLLLLVKTPTSTTNAQLTNLALQFCNLDPTVAANKLPCKSVAGADRADRYDIFTKYLTDANYETALGATKKPADSDAARRAYWAGIFASSALYAGDLGGGAKYSATFGLEALRVDLTGSELLFAFKPRDSVSTGTYNATSGVISSRAVTRSFTDEYQLALKPPSFAYYLSFTDQQESKDSNDPTKPDLKKAVYYNRQTLLDGPVHTNGVFYYTDRPWFSDEVRSAGCAIAETDPNKTPPQGCNTFRTNRTAVQNDGGPSDSAAVDTSSGYPAFTGYPVDAPFSPTYTAPEFVKENATLDTTNAGKPWTYTGNRNANVEELPNTTGDQKAYAQGTSKLLPANVSELGIYVNTVPKSPVPAAGSIINDPAPRIELMATASTPATTTGIVPLSGTQVAEYQFIQIKALKQLKNCPAVPTAISIDPISKLLTAPQSQIFTAKLTGAAGSDKNTYEEAAIAQKFDWNPITPDATLKWDPAVLPDDGSNSVNFKAKKGYSAPFNLVAKARGFPSLTASAEIAVGAADPSVTLNADRGDVNYDDSIKKTPGNGVVLTWVGSGVITGYRVEFNRNGAGWQTLNNLPDTATGLEVYPTDYSTTSDTVPYQYRVIAIGLSVSADSVPVKVNLNVTPLKFDFKGVGITEKQTDPNNPEYNGPGYTGSPVTRTFSWEATGGIPPYKYSGVNAGGTPYDQDAYPPSPNTVIKPTTTETTATGSVTVNMLKNMTLSDYSINYHMQVTDARGKVFTDYEITWIKGPVAPSFTFTQPAIAPPKVFNVDYGGKQTLTWTKADGSEEASFKLNNTSLGITNLAQLGNNSVGGTYTTPALGKNTTFEMVATNTPGQVEKRYVTVIVAPQQPPQIDKFTADPTSLKDPGGTTRLQWGVRFADTVKIERVTGAAWTGGTALTTPYEQPGNPVGTDPAGSAGISNALANTSVYRLTATNSQGVVIRFVRVFVGKPGKDPGVLPEPPVITEFTATPPTLIYPSGNSTIAWKVTGATTVKVTRIKPDGNKTDIGSGDSGSKVETVTSTVTAKDTYTVNYLLSATNDFGTVSQIVSVAILPPNAPDTNLTVDDDTLSFVTGSAKLSWGNIVAQTGTVKYTLQSSPNGSTWSNVSGMVDTAATTYDVAFAQNNTNGEIAKYYRVIAKGTASSLTSEWDSLKITQKPAEAPTVTVDVSKNAVNFNGETIAVSWSVSNPTQASEPLTYLMEYQDDGGSWTKLGTTASGTNVSSAVPKGIDKRIYRFTATGPKIGTVTLIGTAQQTVIVNLPKLEINSFTTDSSSVNNGSSAKLTWSITSEDSSGLTSNITNNVNATDVANGAVKASNISRTINEPITYTLTARDSKGQEVFKKVSIDVILPAAELIGLTLTKATIKMDAVVKNDIDAGWVLTPTWGPGKVPTVNDGDYTITTSNTAIINARVVNGKVLFDIKSDSLGGPKFVDFTVPISLTVDKTTKSVTSTPIMTLEIEGLKASLRPRAQLTGGTCASDDRVGYTWAIFTEYMIDKDGKTYTRTYPSTSQTDWIAPTSALTQAWDVLTTTFNGVMYIEGGMTVSGPTRNDSTKASTAPPAIAGFMALTIATNGDVVIPKDLKYEFPVCSKAPSRDAATQKVTPATCNRNPTTINPWKRNALGIYTSNGDVLLDTSLPSVNLQAIVMASTGEIKVKGVDEPICPSGIDADLVTVGVGDIEIQGGLIQKYYGKFAKNKSNGQVDCGYGRSMTYDVRMKDASYAPPGFPTAKNAAWAVSLKVKGVATALTGTDTLPLSNGFSRLK